MGRSATRKWERRITDVRTGEKPIEYLARFDAGKILQQAKLLNKRMGIIVGKINGK